MISDELAHLPKSARTRLRILTGAPAARVDPRLHPWLMPYDDRLDGCDSPLPGTRSDFASRAAHHFVEAVVLDTPKASAEDRKSGVEGKSVSVRVDLGGRRLIKKKHTMNVTCMLNKKS